MIKIIIVTNDSSLNELIDSYYIGQAGMKKIVDGVYFTNKNIRYKHNTIYRELMGNKHFRDNVVSFYQNTDGEIADIKRHYEIEEELTFI